MVLHLILLRLFTTGRFNIRPLFFDLGIVLLEDIEDFERYFPGATTIILDENYRSKSKILKLANTFFTIITPLHDLHKEVR